MVESTKSCRTACTGYCGRVPALMVSTWHENKLERVWCGTMRIATHAIVSTGLAIIQDPRKLQR